MSKYEGAEKLLEVWFFNDSDRSSPRFRSPDLRDLNETQIKHMLTLSHCEIVSESHNNWQLSFVLSESSLFITTNRIILKTCGRTEVLRTLKPLIQYALCLGFTKYLVYYSRRSFLFPELQASPHKDFKNEVDLLDQFCIAGSGYTFGRLNGDCWNFYYGRSTSSQLDEPPGQTLELMMRDLDATKMELFYARTSRSAEEATKRSGIADLFSYGRISSHLFSPCGYSANGLLNGDEYFTIHVTPEPEFSYVSFETNVAMENYLTLISRVLDIFRPSSFICAFFSDSSSTTYSSHHVLEETDTLPSYHRNVLHTARMDCRRKLTFAEYFRVVEGIKEAELA